MNRRNAETYKMLTRVTDSVTNNAELFAKSSASVEVQTSLKTVMGKLAILSSARIATEAHCEPPETSGTSRATLLKPYCESRPDGGIGRKNSYGNDPRSTALALENNR